MDIIAKIKEQVKSLFRLARRYEQDLFLVLCLLLTAGIGFNIGVIRAGQDQISSLDQSNIAGHAQHSPALPTATPDQRVVVSKSSKSMVYHYSWCSGAKSIAVKNQVWFASAAAAEAAGYTLAANCKP